MTRRRTVAAFLFLLACVMAQAQTVYITKTGEKYHAAGCRYLSKSAIAIDVAVALAQGYGACSVCRPPSPRAKETAPAPVQAVAAEQVPVRRDISGSVVAIHDGDTLTVLVGTTQHKIRLNGIDAPELGQAWSQRSRELLASLCFGKTVRVRVLDTDKYGRELGDVYAGEVFVNAELVRAGLAWHYKAYSRDTALAALEAEARAQKRGLWADANPIPPWDYRED